MDLDITINSLSQGANFDRIHTSNAITHIDKQRNNIRYITMTTKNELIERANELGLDVNSKMTKSQLVDAIDAFVADDDNTMSVADLARELNVSPKIARAKLRRRGIYAKHGSHVRFTRDDDVYNEYVAIITSTRANANA